MKLLVLLLTIIAFSNCEDFKVVVKNFEAKIQSLLAAKNFDGVSDYLTEKVAVKDTNKDDDYSLVYLPRQDFINCLKNGTIILFKGVGPNVVPEIESPTDRSQIFVGRYFDKRRINYVLKQQNGTEFGYLLATYSEAKHFLG